jgi:hypothetical protein
VLDQQAKDEQAVLIADRSQHGRGPGRTVLQKRLVFLAGRHGDLYFIVF